MTTTNGRLKLNFEYREKSSRTILAHSEQLPPLQVVRAFTLDDGMALVHLHNVSGGVLGGDFLELLVEVGPQAKAQLTSTSATRLYRSRQPHLIANQCNAIKVQSGGLLEYVPDALIPFAGARYCQQTKIELASNAGVFWWEIVAPGREAHNEVFAYDALQLNMDIAGPDRFILKERVRLEPSLRPLNVGQRLGQYRYFANFYVCRVGLSGQKWRELETELAALTSELSRKDALIWGVSTLAAHGLVIRAMGCNYREISAGLHKFWQKAKLALYAQPAVPPRKIY